MKPSLVLSIAISLAAVSFIPSKTVRASSFSEQELNQNQFAVVAAPYRHGYNLLVLEQFPAQKKCWSEVGHSPTVIEPLFLNFDFTDACKRSSDSNSYSIRFNGKDFGMDYLTDIVEKDGELHLVGVPRDSNKPQLHIGRTHGLKSGSLKIVLDPQWRLTKRVHGNNTTEHLYLSNTKSEKLVSHAVEPIGSTQQVNHPGSNVAPVMQPVIPTTNPNYQPPTPNGYQQPVYQQPVYQQVVPTSQQPPNVYPQQSTVSPSPQPSTNVYPQPAYYPVAPTPQQPTNVYPQPVYQQPVNTGYRQY